MLLTDLKNAYDKNDTNTLRSLLKGSPGMARMALSQVNLVIHHPDLVAECLKLLEEIKGSHD